MRAAESLSCPFRQQRLSYREDRLLESTTDLGPTTRGTYGPAISPLLLQGWSSTSHKRDIAMHNEIVVGLDDSPSSSWPFGVEHAEGVLASCPVVAVPRTLAANVAQNPRPVLDHTTTLASA